MLIFPIFVVKLKIKIMTSNRVKRNIYFGLGMIGQQILEYTRESIVLTKIYQYNVVAKLVENLMNQLPALPL